MHMCWTELQARKRVRPVDLEAAVCNHADAVARQRLLKRRLTDATLQPHNLQSRAASFTCPAHQLWLMSK